MTDRGQLMRCGVGEVRIAARKTMGVTVFRVGDGERVVSVAAVPTEEDEEQVAEVAEAQDPERGTDDGEAGPAGRWR